MKKLFFGILTICAVTIQLQADYGYYDSQSYQGQRGCTQQNGYYNQGPAQYYSQPQGPYYYEGHQDNYPQGEQGRWQQDQRQRRDQGYGYQGPRYGYEGSDQNQPMNQNAPRDGQIDDQKISNDVQDELNTWFSNAYKKITFTVNQGAVTLRGTVETQKDRAAIVDKVRKIKGVRSVNNQINVSGEQNAPSNNYQRNY